jgi:hypothetical protein
VRSAAVLPAAHLRDPPPPSPSASSPDADATKQVPLVGAPSYALVP